MKSTCTKEGPSNHARERREMHVCSVCLPYLLLLHVLRCEVLVQLLVLSHVRVCS
jgi:hypothetical protein